MKTWIKTSEDLFKWRKQNCLTLSQAAKIAGCSKSDFDKAEQGQIDPVTILIAVKDYELNKKSENAGCDDDQPSLF